ncbi:MAG: superoxide dismutase, partial [Acidimicrobiia bacterium]
PRGRSLDPETGAATRVDLRGQTVVTGDGLVVSGRMVYVIQNDDQVTVVRLDRGLDGGEVRRMIMSTRFRQPSTADLHRRSLYVVNARFDTTPAPDTEYDVVRVRA